MQLQEKSLLADIKPGRCRPAGLGWLACCRQATQQLQAEAAASRRAREPQVYSERWA